MASYESVGGGREEEMDILRLEVVVDAYLTLQLIATRADNDRVQLGGGNGRAASTKMPRYKLLEGQVSIRNNCRERDANAVLTSGYEWKSGVRNSPVWPNVLVDFPRSRLPMQRSEKGLAYLPPEQCKV